MVKVIGMTVESIQDGKRNVVVSLMADTQAEVTACGASGAHIAGLTADDTIVLGSTAFCVDGSFGMINSSGVWNW